MNKLLNETGDLVWLLETHLRGQDVPVFASYVLSGNEDAPESVTLYAGVDPLVTDEPVAIYEAYVGGRLVRTK